MHQTGTTHPDRGVGAVRPSGGVSPRDTGRDPRDRRGVRFRMVPAPGGVAFVQDEPDPEEADRMG